MFRRFFKIVVALVALAPAVSAVAQTAGGSIGGLVRDASGAAIPGATVRIVNEVTGVSLQAVSDEQGAYRTTALGPGAYSVEISLDGFEAAGRRIVLAAGQTAAVDVTLNPSRLTESVVVTARRVEEVAQEVPIPLSVVDGDACGEHGVLQRQPSEGTDPDRPVLLDQSTELGDQHQRSGRAVRPDERWPRAGRRPVHRRRLLLAARVGDARLPRRRSHRSAARTAGDALRQEHDRRRDQRHDSQAELHARHRFGAQRRRSGIRPGEGRGNRPAPAEGGGPAVVLGHGAQTARSTTSGPMTASTTSTTSASGGRYCSRRLTGSRSRRQSTTRGNGRRVTRRWSRVSHRRCAPRTGSTHRSPPTLDTWLRASTRSTAGPTSILRCGRIRISAARR